MVKCNYCGKKGMPKEGKTIRNNEGGFRNERKCKYCGSKIVLVRESAHSKLRKWEE